MREINNGEVEQKKLIAAQHAYSLAITTVRF